MKGPCPAGGDGCGDGDAAIPGRQGATPGAEGDAGDHHVWPAFSDLDPWNRGFQRRQGGHLGGAELRAVQHREAAQTDAMGRPARRTCCLRASRAPCAPRRPPPAGARPPRPPPRRSRKRANARGNGLPLSIRYHRCIFRRDNDRIHLTGLARVAFGRARPPWASFHFSSSASWIKRK